MFLLVQNSFVSQFASCKRNHNKYSLENSWIRNSRLVKLSDEPHLNTDGEKMAEVRFSTGAVSDEIEFDIIIFLLSDRVEAKEVIDEL